ncbi:hypothetical protein FB45DRAFT_1054950 [Roridomyces roridus]|uniref:Uncharacterized protein n=1 Tax=Roridomyces roridus TaxID=1738132 RepID=A0AAD7FTR3_9AGAR|nr:hypothetical protein FB45DRAFT_1054950 [Roridomyces roridus]
MCYAAGSVDQAVNVCPMCRVFPHSRCPHQRGLCTNRTAHPRFDVLFLKNAEVDCFRGCGFCKWASASPKAAGWNNTGWPGCCRAPTSGEHRLIQPAEWRSVSVVHHVPIPSEVKVALDNIPSRGSSVPSTSPVRSSKPPVDRRNSSASAKSPAMPIPSKSRANGSPQMTASSVTSTSSRGSGGSGGSGGGEESHKRRETVGENSSPGRKQLDLADPLTPPRRNSGPRPPAKVVPDERRRSPPSAQSPKVSSKSSPPVRAVDPPKPQKKAEPPLSSASSSSGSDSLRTESTITSDGGFTDYLSDESEAELQRQAEAKAALVAQNEAEEFEFRQARQALANVGLKPPNVVRPPKVRT